MRRIITWYLAGVVALGAWAVTLVVILNIVT